jgi:hypothetical protein
LLLQPQHLIVCQLQLQDHILVQHLIQAVLEVLCADAAVPSAPELLLHVVLQRCRCTADSHAGLVSAAR